MKFNKLYLTLAAGALSIVPVVAADATTSATPAAAPAKAEASKAAAPKVDVWSKLPDVVATVDGKPVTKAELIAFIKPQLPNGEIPPQITPEIIAQNAPEMVREMISERLCKADFEARKPKITKEDARKFMLEEFNHMPEQQKKRLQQTLAAKQKTVEQLIEDQIARPEVVDKIAQTQFFKTMILKDVDVSDAEAKKYYDEHITEAPEVMEASHILVQVKPGADEAAKKAALDKINRIAAEVKKNPAAFAEIARKESDCPSKEQGGKLDTFTPRQMVPEFSQAVSALKQGEISGVVKTQFGYHIIRCDAPLHRIAFETVKNNIKQMLKSQKVEQAINNYVDGLLKQNKVVILVKAPELPVPAQAPAAPAAPATK